MATIREVANRSGVSTATVSHVVNGKTEKVSAETRDRVLAAIRDLRYRPPAMEDRQRALLSKTIAVIVPDLDTRPLRHNEYLSDVLGGVLEASLHLGWSSTIFAERVWSDVGQTIRRSYDGRCDGTIVIGPQQGLPLVDGLVERGFPVVSIGTTAWCAGLSSVDVDNVAIGQMAAKTFLDAGHTSFVYVGPGPGTLSSNERERSFRAALVRDGVHPSRVPAIHTGFSVPAEDEAVDAVLATGATAALCWNDDVACGLRTALIERGLTLPRDFSLLGVDDHRIATEIGLSSFRQDAFDLGRRATELLVDLVRDPSHGDISYRAVPELIARESVAAPPAP